MKSCLIGAMLVMLFSGCSTSMITSSWKSPDVTVRSYKKILVLGLIGEPDRTVREKMEQHISNDLKELGYDAVCACETFSPKAFEGLNEKESVQMISKEGFDAVLTVVLLDKRQERNYTAANIYYSPYSIQQRQFWRYYSTMYGRVYQPGYYQTTTKYFWETNLYDLSGLTLVYSAQSQSFDPESYTKLAHEYGQMIVKNMEKQGVLPRTTAPLKSF